MRKLQILCVLIAISLLVPGPIWSQEDVAVRIATDNIKFLSEARLDQTNRQGCEAKIEEVIELLDADVIGLQEIDNRYALERVFDPADWILIIDEGADGDADDQNVALAVRLPFNVVGFDSGDFNADDQHVLFTNV